MTPHDWFIEQRTAYATRMLDPADERAFAEHLRGCEECRTEVAAIEREFAWLPMGAAPAPLRPGLTRRILDDIVEPRRTRLLLCRTRSISGPVNRDARGVRAGRRGTGRMRQHTAITRYHRSWRRAGRGAERRQHRSSAGNALPGR